MTEPPIGNKRAGYQFFTQFPQVSFLSGPEHVGKTAWAEYALAFNGVQEVDVMRLEPLTAEGVRQAQTFLTRAPFGAFRVLIASLVGSTSQARNGALKLLEEPPGQSRIILIGNARQTEATILSRVTLFPFGYLSRDAVESVLLLNGVKAHEARQAADISSGSVPPEISPTFKKSVAIVKSVIKALQERDASSCLKATQDWSRECTALLRVYANELCQGTWRVFSAEEELTRLMTFKVLAAIDHPGDPRLQARAGFDRIIQELRSHR